MYRRYFYIIIFIAGLVFLDNTQGHAQYKVRGTVYDSSRTRPIELVSVLSTSGRGAVTNANGEYEIEVSERDSIWFSYLNKPTVKFPVLKMTTPLAFDIALQVNIPTLGEVKVRPRNYRQDSIQNRQDYAKIFNYQKPGLKVVTPQTQYGAAVGFDLDELINVFRFRRNRSMAAFQRRLIAQEQEKFVDHRFSKALIRRLTNLDGNALDSFIMIFRPSYRFTVLAGDYDFQKYIKDSYERFRKGLGPWEAFREEDEDE